MHIVLLIFAFLLGSIPVGFIVGKLNGIDLRKSGSGNIGATNALRTLGKKAGILTLLGDLLKGVVAVSLGLLFYENQFSDMPELLGLMAVLGHCFSPFLKFKGGKGVATSLGVFLVLNPIGILAALVVFLIVVKISEFVSLGSISAAIVLTVQTIISENFKMDSTLLLVTIATSLLIVAKHAANISRLLRGEEKSYRSKSAT